MMQLSANPLVLQSGQQLQPVEVGPGFGRHAANLERLAADRRLLDRLMWAQYTGREWELFRSALAEYAVAVLAEWIFSGRMFAECQKKGRPIRRRRQVDRDEALGQAGETVVHALRFFHQQVLVPGLWDVTRGATIRTYFVGACILHFPNVYNRSSGSAWVERFTAKDEATAVLDNLEDETEFGRPERVAIATNALKKAVPNSETREMVLGTAADYTQEEIADRLGLTRKAVEMRMSRLHGRKK